MRVAGYNPRQRMISHRRPLLLMLALVFLVPAPALTSWDSPLDELAKQIAAIAGPGPAKLTIKNRSSLPVEQVPAIRRTLERDLQSYGVTASSSAEVATVIRVTLSENLQHELWIAEVQEGTEVKVVMVSTDPLSTATTVIGRRCHPPQSVTARPGDADSGRRFCFSWRRAADGYSGAGTNHSVPPEQWDVGSGSIFRHCAFAANTARPTRANCTGNKPRTFVRGVHSRSSLQWIGEQWTIGTFLQR